MIIFDKTQNIFHLSNEQISYIIGIEKGKYLTHRYYGTKITHYHNSNALQLIDRGFATNPIPEERVFSLNALPLETSTHGSHDYRISNFQFCNASGEGVTAFEYDRFKIYDGKPELSGLPSLKSENCMTLEITLVDRIQHLEQILYYSIFNDFPLVTRSVQYRNLSSQNIYLEKAGSMLLDLPHSEFNLTTLYGAHTNEANLATTPLRPGIQGISSLRGTSSPQHQPFIALSEPDANEDIGEVYGFHLIYSGNFLAEVEVEQYGSSRVQIGIHPDTFQWKLEPDTSFQSPEVVLNYSASGFNGLSQTFHRVYQECLMPKSWRSKERPILLNTWEGNYFDFHETELLKQADLAQELGIELFVLDDGWFGERDDDTRSLGDWTVNQKKLPSGIEGLAKAIHQRQMKFGLWFEPEMISKKSQLFEEHPDWALQVKNYPLTEGRQQLVLDLSKAKVQDFLIQMLTEYLKDGNIDYIKWDMNRHLTEVSNQNLPADQQKEVSHRYVLGLYHVLETITKRFPDVLFENCSSGGGRFDPGMMAYMPQTWTSDNSDALCRSEIQYGYSYLYPPIMMGAHVSDVPNHQVGRITPLETRGLIAMSGNFGYELAISQQSQETLVIIKEQIAFYKKHRRLLQFGEFYRLQAPNAHFATAWLFKNEEEALLIYFHGLAQPAQKLQYLKMKYLDNSALYKNTQTDVAYSGSELNHAGILIPRVKGDFQSFYQHWQKV